MDCERNTSNINLALNYCVKTSIRMSLPAHTDPGVRPHTWKAFWDEPSLPATGGAEGLTGRKGVRVHFQPCTVFIGQRTRHPAKCWHMLDFRLLCHAHSVSGERDRSASSISGSGAGGILQQCTADWPAVLCILCFLNQQQIELMSSYVIIWDGAQIMHLGN